MKDRVRQLVETPLFVNAELVEQNCLEENSRIVQIIHKQPGIYGMLRASQVNMRKSMQAKLEKNRICLTSVLPGIYLQD